MTLTPPLDQDSTASAPAVLRAGDGDARSVDDSEAAEHRTIPVLVAAEQVRTLYERTPEGLLGGGVFACLLTWALTTPANGTVASLWLAAKLMTLLWRWLDWRAHARDAQAPDHASLWHRRHALGSGLDGLGWGLLAPLFLPTGNPALDGVVVAGLVGVASVGVFTLASRFDDAVRFMLLTLFPLAAQQAWQGGTVGWLVAGSLTIYFLVLCKEGSRHQARERELLRLRFENAAIAEERAHAVRLAQQSNTAKSRFLATVSHELRTPLNGILGMTELLQQDAPTPLQAARLGVLQQSSQYLLTLIGDLLDISRIEFGRLTLLPEPADPAALASEVANLLGPVASARGLALHLVLAPDLPTRVLVDPARVRQVLLNLTGNALKFTVEGSVTLMASTRPGGLRFSVLDTGPGIAPEQLAHIFEAFVQGGPGSGTSSGTGLGLAISRHLARAMGGELSCENLPGAGARFDFDLACTPPGSDLRTDSPALPATLITAEAPVSPPGIASTRPQTLHSAGTILVAEDNPVNALVATGMLDLLGLRSEVVGDGVQALERLAQGGIALVLMDCQMPRLDGWEAAQRWRAQERSGGDGTPAHVPIIALTANAVVGDRERCLAAGMDDYLAKPFNQEALHAVLVRYLARGADNAAPCASFAVTAPPPRPAPPTPDVP